jgi:Cu+-exporting ATPase
MKTINLKITGMHCTSCALSIDWELEDTKGIQKIVTNYARQISKITFDDKVLSQEKIEEAIKKLGYKSTPLN